MNPKLKVKEFDKKQKLVDYVNENADALKIVSISSSQMSFEFSHFLWFYDK
jgi:hypothetical protein